MEISMRNYTPDELLRGRFLRHFMGLENDVEETTEEDEALTAHELNLPKTRETERPQRLLPTAH